MRMISAFICTFLVLSVTAVHAQRPENEGWVFLTHNQKVNKKLDILFDMQVRTSDRYEYLNSLLLRTALSYNFTEAHSIAFGVAYKPDREKKGDLYEFSHEYRIFQQYAYQFKISRTEITTRGRLEQRWIGEEKLKFSQRTRALLSAQIPVIANLQFSKGFYTGIQNEIFLNITNKANVNHSLFDQNRIFLSLGYRWSKKIDTEMGYMFLYQKNFDDQHRSGIFQIQVTTNL